MASMWWQEWWPPSDTHRVTSTAYGHSVMATVCWSLWYSYSVMVTICWPLSGCQCVTAVVWWPLSAGYCVMATVWWALRWPPCGSHYVMAIVWSSLCDGHHTIATVWGSLLFGGACVMVIVRCPPCDRAWDNALCQNICLVHKKSQVQSPAPLYHPKHTQRGLFTLSCQNSPLPHYK